MFGETKQETGMEQPTSEELAQASGYIMVSPSTNTWILGI
jgi:hypothetical protein